MQCELRAPRHAEEVGALKLSTRERWLLALLFPALSMLAWRELVGARTLERVARARARLDTATSANEDVPGRLQSSCEVLEKEIESLEDRLGLLGERVAALTSRWSRTSQRSASLRNFVEILRKHAVPLERSEPLADDDSSGRVTPELRELVHEMVALGGEAPQLWRLELRGPYAGVSAALAACNGGPNFVMPLSLTARAAARGASDSHDALAFVLWLWI